MRPFDEFRSNVFSQNGEDGILAELLTRLEREAVLSRWCVEFGAWNGKHLSNTFKLVREGWHAVYIEGDAKKFADLQETCAQERRITPLQAMVSAEAGHLCSLDRLLSGTSLPADYDLLSIDIDSHDLAVWHAYSGRPKIVVIEVNSSALPGILWWHGDQTAGNTFSSTLQVGRQKGYSLVAHTGNMIFVRNDLIGAVGLNQIFLDFPELLFDYAWTMPDKKKRR